MFVDVFEENNPALKLNPLGLIPVLRTPEGCTWFDSSIILEQLHDRTGSVWPKEPDERARIRQASAMATGLMHAAVSLFQEKSMHEPASAFWLKEHQETIERTWSIIANSEEELWIRGGELTQAGWDLAVAEEYLAFRAPEIRRPEPMEGGRRKVGDIAAKSGLFKNSRPRND